MGVLISHQLTRQLATVRKPGEISWLLPDGKVIVTLAYKKKDGVIIPQYIDTILISVQHLPGIDIKILNIVKNHFNFKPQKMIDQLKLQRPIYHATSCYGHFGRKEFS